MDSFYTPPSLSKRLADSVVTNEVRSIADFSIGGGELIKALVPRFHEAEIYGVDISQEVIQELKKQYADWNLAVCDFMDEKSRNTIGFLEENSFDLIVQNSPFTCKGSTIYNVDFDGRLFKVSIAMLFLLTALKYISEQGGVYAILPISCIYSQKDHEAWRYLKECYNACVLEEPKRYYFSKKCSPNIVLVYAGSYKVKSKVAVMDSPFNNFGVSKIVRGAVKMQNLTFSSSYESFPLVHTTNMKNGGLVGLKNIIGNKIVEGPGVLIPRVCNPNPGKIVLLNEGMRVVLSDCVMLLQTGSQEEAKKLKELIHFNWNAFEGLYKGTGARYTTVSLLYETFGAKHIDRVQIKNR